MIASLFGEIVDRSLNSITIEVNGVGYELYIGSQVFDQLTIGQKTRLFVHESIREDAYDLYGFANDQSKKLFEQLISVKNVGPKVGLAILGIGSSDQVREAIAAGNLNFLMSAKGVGKKAAEQLIVELRGRVGLMASTSAEDVVTRSAIDHSDEALQALVSLGYSDQDAATFLKSVDPKLPVDERLKLALKGAAK